MINQITVYDFTLKKPYNSVYQPTSVKTLSVLEEITAHIKSVQFNGPATIVMWDDNTKTVVKCHKGEPFDKETGLAMAILKKLHYNKAAFNTVLKKKLK